MSNLNICSFICKKADDQKQTIENIINEIEYSKHEKANFHIVTAISGIGIEKDFYLDYFMSSVEDENDEENRGKYLYLFSLHLHNKKSEFQRLTQYKNSMFAMSYNEVSTEFPHRGFYELEIYKAENEFTGEAKERYRNYHEKKINPVSVYNICVK